MCVIEQQGQSMYFLLFSQVHMTPQYQCDSWYAMRLIEKKIIIISDILT